MKKRILFALLAFVSFPNISMAVDACSTSGGKTVIPTSTGAGNRCSVEPDFFQIKIYDMKLCASAPTAPTTSAAAVLTVCQTVLSNSSGGDVSVTEGVSSALTGTISRPTNGTYTHGYLRISNDFVIKDSRQYSATLTDGANSGDYCATTSSGVSCDTSTVTAASRTFALEDFSPGSDVYSSGDMSTSEGTVNAYLVDSDEKLEADTDSDVTYLVGVQEFTTPIVITENTTTMDASFKVTTGMAVINGGDDEDGNATLMLVNGPFSVKMSVQ